MLGRFFVEIFSAGDFFAIDKDGDFEAIAVVHLKALEDTVIDFVSVFLAVFKELAFVVVIHLFEFADVEMAAEDLADDDVAGAIKASFNIDRTDQGLEGIAFHGFAQPGIIVFLQHHVDAHIICDPVEGLALDDLGSHLGQKSFVAVRIFLKEIFGDDRAQDRIAQVFESLVAGDSMEFGIHSRFMAEGLLEDLEIGGRKADDVRNRAGKLTVWGKKVVIEFPDHKCSQANRFTPDQR